MLTTRGRVALVLAAGVYLAAWALGTAEAYVLAVGLGLAVLLAAGYVRVAQGPFRLVRRSGPGERVEGQELDVRVELRVAGGLMPVSATLHESLVGDRVVLVSLARDGGVLRGRYHVSALPRGRYRFGDGRLTIEDPFGLARSELAVPGEGVLVVYPRIAALGRLFSDAGGPNGAAGRYLLSRGSGFDLHSVRDHQRGESLRRVHWPSTARRQKLMVKELEDAPRDEASVVLDAHGSLDVGTAPDSSFELMVRAAGSLVRRLALDGQRAALVVSGARVERVPVTSLEGDWQAALDLLAVVRDDGRRSLAAVLGDASSGLDAVRLFCVTSDLTPLLAERLTRLAGRRRVSVVWVDARSFGTGNGAPGAPDGIAVALARRGVPVVRLRRGDDLAELLTAPEPEGAVQRPREAALR